MKRLYYIDNLKLLLIVLVVFHHACQPYSPFSSWAYVPSDSNEVLPWIWHFESTNAAFFMGLFFLISGFFIPGSFDKQGTKLFCKKKLIRLGIPLLLIGLAFTILTGGLEIGHLWFLELLLVFDLLYVLVRSVCKPVNKECDSKPTILGLLAVGSIMGAGSFLIRRISPQNNWIWFLGFVRIEPAHILQYAMMFVLGVMSYRFDWLEKMKNRVGLISFCIGTALVVGNYLRGDGEWNTFVSRWFGIYESLLCVFFSFGLLWLFREYGNRTDRFLGWMSGQLYGVFIFHLPVLLGIQFATDGFQIPVVLKFLIIGTLTMAISFAFTWLVRQIPAVRRVI